MWTRLPAACDLFCLHRLMRLFASRNPTVLSKASVYPFHLFLSRSSQRAHGLRARELRHKNSACHAENVPAARLGHNFVGFLYTAKAPPFSAASPLAESTL